MHIKPLIVFLVVLLVSIPVGNPAFAMTERRPLLPTGSPYFLEKGGTEVYVEYEHEESATAREGSGQVVANPDGVKVDFNTVNVSLRHGLSSRINLVATVPFYSIVSSRSEPLFYERSNRGFGDPLVVAEYSFLSESRLVLIGGFKLPISDTDRTDELGQTFADELALGSGKLDFILGGRLRVPSLAIKHMEVFVEARHRFRGGVNKWGYEFGDETNLAATAAYPFSKSGQLGLRLKGYRLQPSVWYGTELGDTGATMLYAGPTAAWKPRPYATLGVSACFPVVMDLEGTQMVSRALLGVTMTIDVDSIVRSVSGRTGDQNQ